MLGRRMGTRRLDRSSRLRIRFARCFLSTFHQGGRSKAVALNQPKDCKTTTVGNLFVVRWHAFTHESCNYVVRAISALHTGSGSRVPYLGIMPDDMARIDDEGRKALETLMTGIEQHCELAAVAVESRGFAGAAYRSLLTGLMLVSGRRARIKFVDTVDAAVELLRPYPLPSDAQIRAAIGEVGDRWAA